MFSLLTLKEKEYILQLPCGHNRAKQVLHNNSNINIPQRVTHSVRKELDNEERELQQ